MRVTTNARRAHVLAFGEGMDATFVEGLPELPVGYVVHGEDPEGAALGRLRWSSQRDGEDETCFGLLDGTDDLHALLEGPARWVARLSADLAPAGAARSIRTS